ncbi:unnamed protein product [Notodromas monacha]|uniref:Ion transport domain-containing protein n=1 Tax=Notodromas monacha TaxID=399045 RepID=A0A7R9BXH3_9CRUS|nr:unnamed protein product [Notodromas monacha]CAG0922613.1 unnamed protein product [Notodromas monacha]
MDFARALLDHTRSSFELEVLLNHNPTGVAVESGERMHLHRLKLAIKYRQKKFVAHPNVQQLLASIWYEGLPGFRRKNLCLQTLEVCRIGIVFPIFCLAYMIAPHSRMGRTMRKPFIKFICNSASYFTFLVLLILASQRIETVIADWFGLQSLKDWISTDVTTKRGAPPTLVEWLILAWVAGLIWSEIKQLWGIGLHDYVMDMWNIIDFITNSLYVATVCLRIVAYFQVQKEITLKTGTAHNPREEWDAWDPMLIAEGLFAAANIFRQLLFTLVYIFSINPYLGPLQVSLSRMVMDILNSLKLVYIFSINPYLGPLQVSLSRMVMDILKFFLLFVLVLFAFSCGMNQLLWYYADLEKKTCYSPAAKWSGSHLVSTNNGSLIAPHAPGVGPILDADACIVWRRFANLFETSQTLFWAAFGLIDLDSFELKGIKSFTRFWGMLMFGCYSTIAIVVLLNLLIAMMNHSYQIISDQADTEWKFARSKLWISYFEEGGTVPPPFNVVPTPKSIYYLLKWVLNRLCGKTSAGKKQYLQTVRRKAKHASDRDTRYQGIMKNLVRRYVTQQQCKADKQGVTEDDVNEIKQDISSFRFELIEILRNSGMKTGNAGGSALGGTGGKKNKQRERRLMKGMFDINTASINSTKSSIVSSSLRNTRRKALPPGTKIASPVAALTSSLTMDEDVESDDGGVGVGVGGGGRQLRTDKKTASAITRMVHLARRVGAQSAITKRRWGTLMEAAKTGSFLGSLSRQEQGKEGRRRQAQRRHTGDDDDDEDRKTTGSASDASTTPQDEELGLGPHRSPAHDPRRKRRQWQETRAHHPGTTTGKKHHCAADDDAVDSNDGAVAAGSWDPMFPDKLAVRRSSSEPVHDAFYKAVIKEGVLLDPLSSLRAAAAAASTATSSGFMSLQQQPGPRLLRQQTLKRSFAKARGRGGRFERAQFFPRALARNRANTAGVATVVAVFPGRRQRCDFLVNHVQGQGVHVAQTASSSGQAQMKQSSATSQESASGLQHHQQNFPGSSSHEPLLGTGPTLLVLPPLSPCSRDGGNAATSLSITSSRSRKYNGSAVIPKLGIEPADKDMQAGWL